MNGPEKVAAQEVGQVAHLCDILAMATQKHFIREWRKHRDLTQAQLAERIGIDKSYLSKIETGQKRYDQPFLEAAAEVLCCTPADLIMRDPGATELLWSIWEQLAPQEREQVVEIAKTFKKAG